VPALFTDDAQVDFGGRVGTARSWSDGNPAVLTPQ
jgi:hypothetical protein